MSVSRCGGRWSCGASPAGMQRHALGQRVEPVADRAHLRVADLERVHLRAKRLAAGQRRAPPSRCACARCARRRTRRTGGSGRRRCSSSQRLDLARRAAAARASPVARKCAISPKIHGRPCAARPIMIASAPVAREHLARLARRVDVAVGDHRNAQRARFTAATVSYSAVALVALLARAAVHRDHRDAGALGGARDARPRCVSLVAPAGAHLQRHRHVVRRARGDHRLDDLRAPAARPASAPSRPTCCTPSWPGSPC